MNHGGARPKKISDYYYVNLKEMKDANEKFNFNL